VNVVFWQLCWFGAPAAQNDRPRGFLFSFLSAIVRTIGTKVTSEVGVTWYFDRAIQRRFLGAKWLNFEGL